MTEIFNLLIEKELTPNSFYVLYCIKEKIVPNKLVNKKLETQRLINQEWLTENLQLTDKSLIFITKIDGYFKKSKKKTSKDLMGDNFMQKIDAYVKIFPNKKLSSGKYARVPAKSLEGSFRWFFENYDYMRTSRYFLRKQNLDKSWDSDLATYCEFLNDTPDVDENPFEELIV